MLTTRRAFRFCLFLETFFLKHISSYLIPEPEAKVIALARLVMEITGFSTLMFYDVIMAETWLCATLRG